MADLVGLVRQRLHDQEEERAPESENDMVSSFNIPLKGLCPVMEMMHDLFHGRIGNRPYRTSENSSWKQ